MSFVVVNSTVMRATSMVEAIMAITVVVIIAAYIGSVM